MEALFKIAGTMCITTYMLGVLANIVDINATQKAVKLIFTLYILTLVFIPMELDIGKSLFSDAEFYADKTEIDEYIISEATTRIENDIKSKLTSENISYSEVVVHINKENSGIAIDCIEIYGCCDGQKDYIAELLQKEGKVVFGD